MRYDVHKYLFIGAAKDKLTFFKAAQEAGIIEFINPKEGKKQQFPADIEVLAHAIKILRGYVQEEQEQKKDIEKAGKIAAQIVGLKEMLQDAEQKKQEIEQEIERILPFGDFSIEEIQAIEKEIKRKIRFFVAKSSKHMDDIEPALILVNQADGVDYFIAIQNEPIASSDLVELHFTESLSKLQEQAEKLSKQIEQAEDELKSLTRYNDLLHHALVVRLNEANLVFAQECSELELENQLFIVEGWVPRTRLKKLKILSDQYHVYSEEVAREPYDCVPTYLENKGTARVGEDLVRIFDTPSTQDKDPSLWVLFAFALFFSMVVYDAGYGLIFLATALFLRFRLKNLTPPIKRFLTLMAILAVACTLWGGLTHSFFGIEFKPDSFIKKHSLMTWITKKKAAYHIAHKDDVYEYYVKKYPELKNATDPAEFLYAHSTSDHSPHPIADKFTDNVLLEFALFLGSIHICLGLIRYIGYNPVGFGWIAFIIGTYLYIPHYLHATSIIHYVFGVDPDSGAEFGIHLLIAGIIYVTIAGVILHGLIGLFEFTHSAQVFADVLSYLRIYALGYAGLTVSETINGLAAGMPLLFAIIVLIFGHVLNIVIAILLGTIHGLRLNFLEWYRYSFYGGGKDFRPLQLMTLE